MICLSTFPVGFEGTIEHALRQASPRIRVKQVYSGLVVYECGDAATLARIGCVSNTFLLLKGFFGKQWGFENMVRAVQAEKVHYLRTFPSAKAPDTFRLRFSRAGQFERVDEGLRRAAEMAVARATGLRAQGDGDGQEFWYILRTEGVGYYAMLMGGEGKAALQKGELRPAFAQLMVHFARLPKGARVLDPFAGSGSIARQALALLPEAQVVAGDIDAGKVDKLKARLKDKRATIARMDARDLSALEPASFDAVITDPPWGRFDPSVPVEALYQDMLREMARVVRPGGVIALLLARGAAIEKPAEEAGLTLLRAADTLVGGQKATVYLFLRGE